MLITWTAWISLFFLLPSSALQPMPTLDIISLSLEDYHITLENQTRVIGLQDALDGNYGSTNGSITVFPNACMQPDGKPNCTAACQDKTQMFSSLTTLHNCAVFPNISVHLANNALSPDARRLAEDLNIEPSGSDSSVPSKISNAIQHCLVDSCAANSDCNSTLSQKRSLFNLTGTLFINNTYLPLCAPIPAHVNADVGGVGVFISYVMQMGLAVLAFILTVPWLAIARRFRHLFLRCLRALLPRHGSREEKPDPEALPRKKYPEALTSALVDFQKAQCFFMLATNIAGLIGDIDSESLQELYNSYVFIKVIAIGGYLPITFTLLNLHMIQQLSWYLLILSVATIGVATSTLAVKDTQFTPTSEDFDKIANLTYTGGPQSCSSQNLIPWCYSPRRGGGYFGFDASSNGSGANAILTFCLVTLAIIIVDHFCRSDDHRQRSLNHYILTKLRISTSKSLFPRARTFLRLGTTTFHFVFFWLYIYCFYIFGSDLDYFKSASIYNPSWGFGQVVAILVWAPTLCDYFWNQIRGVPAGSEHKLPKTYKVVKQTQQQQQQENQPIEAELSPFSSSQRFGSGALSGKGFV